MYLRRVLRDKLYLQYSALLLKRNFHEELFIGSVPIKTPINTYYNHYLNLRLPDDKIFATYVWIDGTGINMRSKDRVLSSIPRDISFVPQWSFDGSSTGQATAENSDILLIPCSIYMDPFRKGKHVMILCETCCWDGTPTSTNHRNHCVEILSKIEKREPWFGMEQEYTMFDTDSWPLGWPKSPLEITNLNEKYSYCGIGASFVVGRHVTESHARACVYSGMEYSGCNAEVMKGSWEFQVGPSLGIRAADDLWMARYLLNRIAENFGVIISYHPKPINNHPGIGCHHNFSTNIMRNDEGVAEIERVCKLLCERHTDYINNYGLNDSNDNKNRLTGGFETSPFESCRYGVADRSASIRLQRSVALNRKGFLEDRRPAGDCDPYRICALLGATCI